MKVKKFVEVNNVYERYDKKLFDDWLKEWYNQEKDYTREFNEKNKSLKNIKRRNKECQ